MQSTYARHAFTSCRTVLFAVIITYNYDYDYGYDYNHDSSFLLLLDFIGIYWYYCMTFTISILWIWIAAGWHIAHGRKSRFRGCFDEKPRTLHFEAQNPQNYTQNRQDPTPKIPKEPPPWALRGYPLILSIIVAPIPKP